MKIKRFKDWYQIVNDAGYTISQTKNKEQAQYMLASMSKKFPFTQLRVGQTYVGSNITHTVKRVNPKLIN